MKRLLVIGVIWFGCALAWMVLGSNILVRSGATSSAEIEEVHLLCGRPLASTIAGGFAQWADDFAAGERHEYTISYRSRGTSTWHYQLTAGTGQVRNFHLELDTNFANVDFPAGTVSPVSQRWSAHN